MSVPATVPMDAYLFGLMRCARGGIDELAESAVILRGRALSTMPTILADLNAVVAQAPFRHMITPGGFTMSVGMTNCGAVGWVTDRSGYRYDAIDPELGAAWPDMPRSFFELARAVAEEAGYRNQEPDSYLINQYLPGARLSLHQDRNERDLSYPIVSISLGLPAIFLFGGPARADAVSRHALYHGDAVIWGGPSRLRYHEVAPLKAGGHPELGGRRVNLTFRKAR
jgi:alkylated DNA repair protein (DNA oxidative demethylase)